MSPCRYRWGTAFPLNRDHSDLIILKQLLFGHRNFAVHDLLQDSWRRAHAFAQQYQGLLIKHHQHGPGKQLHTGSHGSSSSMPSWLAAQQFGVASREEQEAISLQPLVEELCSSTTGGTPELGQSPPGTNNAFANWGFLHPHISSNRAQSLIVPQQDVWLQQHTAGLQEQHMLLANSGLLALYGKYDLSCLTALCPSLQVRVTAS